jgi:carbonic anhydrase
MSMDSTGAYPPINPKDNKTVDFTYRFNPASPKPFFVPKDWQEAELYLRVGNELSVRFHDACKHHGYASGERPSVVEISSPDADGEPRDADGLPRQMPFALMLGCSDARVPTELLFGQEFNDIFNIRVAGNVLAEEGVGSLLYALRSFVPETHAPGHRSLKLIGVIGHRGCGAVRATVRAFHDPLRDAAAFGEPIGTILRRITAPALLVAAEAINTVFGKDAAAHPSAVLATVELTVYLNAAWVAHEVEQWVERAGPEIASRVGVRYGVFDPNDWRVRSIPLVPGDHEPQMFANPPKNQDELRSLALTIAQCLPSSIHPKL